MSEFRKRVAVLLLLLLVPLTATADLYDLLGEGSWYASMRAGFLASIESEGRFVGPTETVYGGTPLIEMDDGSQLILAVGREVFSDWRLEFELGLVGSQTLSAAVPGTGPRLDDVFELDADVDSIVFMANLGYDFNHLDWWAKPYFRGGIGLSANDVDGTLSVEYNSPLWAGTALEGQRITNQPFVSEDYEAEFAWTFAAGFKKALAERFVFRLEYSFLDRGEAATGLNEDGDFVLFSDLESHQFSLGVDYRFD